MTTDRAQAVKIANELMDTLTINPHQKHSAWPLAMFEPLARDYLRLVTDKPTEAFTGKHDGQAHG